MSNIEVIGAGFGRTGTNSLRTALNILGYHSYHMLENVSHLPRRDIDLWEPLGRGEPVDDKAFTRALGTYTATTDFPACWHYKELLRRNPKAKVVLTVRDPEKWYASCVETIFKAQHIMETRWLLGKLPPYQFFVRTVKMSYVVPIFKTRQNFYNKEYCIKVFKDHIEEVKRTVPADQLLVFQV